MLCCCGAFVTPSERKDNKIFLDLCSTCERGTFFNQLHPTRLDCCRCYYFYSKGNLPADFDNHSIEIFFVCSFFCWMDLSGFRSTIDDRMEIKQQDWPKYWINFTKVPSHPLKKYCYSRIFIDSFILIFMTFSLRMSTKYHFIFENLFAGHQKFIKEEHKDEDLREVNWK